MGKDENADSSRKKMTEEERILEKATDRILDEITGDMVVKGLVGS